MTFDIIALVAITLLGATVNGALGYGFSSLTVPVALIFYANRILNPAIILLEVPLNAHVLWTNRVGIRNVWRRVLPIVIGLLPGLLLGSFLLHSVEENWVKFVTYVALAPMILLQAAGIRRAIRAERAAGLALGTGVGVLYSLTTISGPPLALMFNNQGYTKQDFRAGLGLVRVVESSVSVVIYAAFGWFTLESIKLIPVILPSILIGIPLGARLIRHVPSETFRRICMSFDAWIIAYGLSLVLRKLNLAQGAAVYSPMAVIGSIDLILMYRFFFLKRRSEPVAAVQAAPEPDRVAA